MYCVLRNGIPFQLRVASLRKKERAMDVNTLKYTPSHEWVAFDGKTATIGITDFAVRQLTDLVNIDLPKLGRKINADIVVMSACYSGLGDRSPLPGDDLFGLQRAFLQSGVRTVVSGLWDVYDGTAPDLMLETFKQLADGKTVMASLASSQRMFLKKLRDSSEDEPWLHPYFWAVYTATGDDRTRFEK